MTIRLKLLRKQKGWTLDVLADETGLTKSYLSKVERGLSVPSIAVALKLSKALSVDVEQLFSESHNRELITVTRAGERTAMGAAADSHAPRFESIAAGVA
ncbi:helix-turn-helix domain-containing protein, partial [Burkholderia sp. LMG 13014]|uniref:helix-turn-helix domain-containing protein n=1 Tax=Burkholderia sp. LMG 13014 TaxID=2709306 RepID=UPI0019662B9E